jgi:hypothetical protein
MELVLFFVMPAWFMGVFVVAGAQVLFNYKAVYISEPFKEGGKL